MQPSFLRAGRTKPPGIPRLNVAHPSASGLIMFAVPDLLMDLVINKPLVKTASPTFASTPIGQGLKCTTANYVSVTPKIGASSQVFTWETLYYVNVATAPSGCSLGNSTGWGAGLVGTFASSIQFTVHGSIGYDTAVCVGGTVAAGGLYHVVGTCDGTNISLYINGTLISGPTAHGAGTLDSIPSFTIGNVTGASNSGTITILMARAWQRCLAANEVRELSNNPWGMATFPDDDIFSMLVGAAANAIALLARATSMSKGQSQSSGKAPLLGASVAQTKATASGVYRMAFGANGTAASASRSPNLTITRFLQATSAAQAKLKAPLSAAASLSGYAVAQAKASLSGVYKMSFSGSAKTASAIKGLLASGAQLSGAGISAAQAKLKSSMSLAAGLSGKASAQAKASLSGVYSMPFAVKAASQAKIIGVFSSAAQLTAAGTSAAQAKLKSSMSLAAGLSGKASAKASASISGVYRMAFSAKSVTQAGARSTFANLLFFTARSVSQAKAKTGNALQIIMAARAKAMGRITASMSGGSALLRSKFYAYFIS